MQLPMMQQQNPLQSPVQGQPGQQPAQGAESFPATQSEAMQFSNDILESINNEQIHANLVEQIKEIPEQVPMGQGIGQISAQLVGTHVSNVKTQTGRPMEMRVALDALKAVVGEVSEIAEGVGRKVEPKDKGEAMQVGVQILNQMDGQQGQPAAGGQQPPMGGQQNGPQPMG